MLNSKSKIKKHFDSLKKPYSSESNWLWKFFRNREKKLFSQLVQRLNKDDCLDLGAGSCEYSEILLQMGAKKAVCVDFSAEIMSLAHDSRIEKIISDVEELNITGKYDLILCLGVLEFLNKPKKFLLYLKKFLKPQGRIVLLLPLSSAGAWAYSLLYFLKGSSLSPLTLKKINRFLIKNNFTLEKIEPASFFSGFSIYSVKTL
ncbi:MAG: class I SAM-dependent methyltransferase [Oligoflexia bacterium]|nr:class I SAM-dependent methyltransferase [Oligoflexia bacterium]